MVPDPTTSHVDPSSTVTCEGVLYDWKIENILRLPVMLSVAPKSIT